MVHWIQDRDKWRVHLNTAVYHVSADSVKGRKILDQPSSYYHPVASAQNVQYMYMYTFHVLEAA